MKRNVDITRMATVAEVVDLGSAVAFLFAALPFGVDIVFTC